MALAHTPNPVSHAQAILNRLAHLSCDEAAIVLDLAASLLAHRRLTEIAARVAQAEKQWAIQDAATRLERAEAGNSASSPAESVKQGRIDTQQKADRLAEQRRLWEEQGPKLWQELRNAVQICIRDVNAELDSPALTYNNLSTAAFSVTRHGKAIGDLLHAEFTVSSGDAAFWKYEGRSKETGSATLGIDESGRVFLEHKGKGITPESLAQEMLNGLK